MPQPTPENLQPILLKKLRHYNHNDIKQGLTIFKKSTTMLEDFDELTNTFNVLVNYGLANEEFVEIGASENIVGDECFCETFDRKGTCKHITAAIMEILFQECDLDMDIIEKLVKKQKLTNEETLKNPTARVVSLFMNEDMSHVPWKAFSCFPGEVSAQTYRLSNYFQAGSNILQKTRLLTENTENTKNLSCTFEFQDNPSTRYLPEFNYDRDTKFLYRCNCRNNTAMCPHVKTAFDWVLNKYGQNYFDKFKDWDKEKTLLLEPHGLKLGDEETKRIEFYKDYYGRLQMKLPAWLWGQNAETNITYFKKSLKPENDSFLFYERPQITGGVVIDFQLGFLFNFLSMHFKMGFELETIKVFENAKGRQLKKLPIHNAANLSLLKELPNDVYMLMLTLTDEGMKEFLRKNGHGYLVNYSNPWANLTEDVMRSIRKYYLTQLKELWPYLCDHPNVYELTSGNFSNNNVQPAKLSATPVNVSFVVEEDDRFVTINVGFVVSQTVVDFKQVKKYVPGLFMIDGMIHMPANLEDLKILDQFNHGYVKIPIANKRSVLTNIIPNLQKKYTVTLPPSLQLKTIDIAPKPQLLLKEYNTQYLMFQPQFVYEELTVNYESDPQDILQTLTDGSWQIIQRDLIKEKAFFENFRLLHHQFKGQKQNDFFYLPFDDVMKKSWFINTVQQLQGNDIPVMGLKELKKFRYNTNKPVWDMKAGTGMDWFDLKIEISFGDMSVPLNDVRKALNSKQNIVLLGDGSIGVLPEEWLQQYGLILKMSHEQKDGTLRLSKLHYTLIDELHDQIDDDLVLEEISDKKERLKDIENVNVVDVSKEITASLRPYQLSGFHWMQTLDELGWGGCLADDMGLGKTLQAITFFQYLKEKYKNCTNLVICPTSLIYNWENELKKFAPKLTYHIYYGSDREFSDEHFEDYDIIITTYGIIRIDLENLVKFNWQHVILDESQMIKNPDAQTTKAVQLLKSKNRLILSGTPVQNNTGDLYAQFNFINPGLLGNREFFKDFSNGIDKYNDQEKAAQLRRLVYPFMLRRTKEQVATDLPDKTEMILWCDMPKEQRAVYDDFKNYYRTTIIKKIEEVGMGKAGMYILEGMLRLRQICDSPELIKSEEVKTDKSVKIDELIREIQENTGQHKLLVFSQFTGMLELIKKRMEQAGIPYAYLDGSTTATNRKKSVNEFQSDPSVKVFLISLKAGGLGLNLTAADYIYLVDPWWNPAVEQQAIDRAHRIGQKRKIFAYKMICKNTIEEKIVELQKKKKQIANELVTEDAGFIKKLKKEDIEFLFN